MHTHRHVHTQAHARTRAHTHVHPHIHRLPGDWYRDAGFPTMEAHALLTALARLHARFMPVDLGSSSDRSPDGRGGSAGGAGSSRGSAGSGDGDYDGPRLKRIHPEHDHDEATTPNHRVAQLVGRALAEVHPSQGGFSVLGGLAAFRASQSTC